MKFQYRVIQGLEDATHNFEQIETALGAPVMASAPSNPKPGQMYFDATKDAAGTPALGYWGPTRGWTYV